MNRREAALILETQYVHTTLRDYCYMAQKHNADGTFGIEKKP